MEPSQFPDLAFMVVPYPCSGGSAGGWGEWAKSGETHPGLTQLIEAHPAHPEWCVSRTYAHNTTPFSVRTKTMTTGTSSH